MAKYSSRHTGIIIDNAVSAVSEKQDKLQTQTAYPHAGGHDVIPSVTTNDLGQVTNISLCYLVQDFPSSVITLSTANWTSLKNNNCFSRTVTLSGLDSSYRFINVAMTISGTTYTVHMVKNGVNNYSGLFFIEESGSLYEITVYYNGTNMILRCGAVY